MMVNLFIAIGITVILEQNPVKLVIIVVVQNRSLRKNSDRIPQGKCSFGDTSPNRQKAEIGAVLSVIFICELLVN